MDDVKYNNNCNNNNNEYEYYTNRQRDSKYYMQEALKVAKTALGRGEVPVGCIIVYNPPPNIRSQNNNEILTSPKILSYGSNRVNATRDATRHAELVALDRIMCQGMSSDQLGLPQALLPKSSLSSSSADDDHDTLEREYPWNPTPPITTRMASLGIQLPFQDWKHCDLYVTCEPCIMCAAALREIGISRVFFGCYNERFGGCGSILNLHRRPSTSYGNDPTQQQQQQQHYYYHYQVTSGILQQEAISLLQQFYKQENYHAPTDRRKRKKNKTILST